MNNRWINALVKTIITWVALHVIFLILGWVFGTQIGWFGLPMVWAHWHRTSDITVGIIASVILYFGIYAFCTNNCEIEDKQR